LACFAKESPLVEDKLPTEKVLTPNCYTIEALADFLNTPTKKTAKAIMLTRLSDKKLIFVKGCSVLKDTVLCYSLSKKLKRRIQNVRQFFVSNRGSSSSPRSPI
jgi:hydroxymethylpyrimidine/phosphomethylpyrimidine kinase